MSQFKSISRRHMLFQAGGGISGLALANLLGTDGLLADPTAGDQACLSGPQNSAAAPRKPHFKPRAKAVISLFMTGGVSHIDTFDPKPVLKKYHGQPLSGFGEIVVRQGYPGPIMSSPFSFKKYGQSGIEVSELFPNVGSIVDDIALIRSANGISNDHVLAHYEWNTGSLLMGFPSVGSWVTYGLGSEKRAQRGCLQLEQRLPSRRLPGDCFSALRRSDSRSAPARRHRPRTAEGPPRSTGETE